MTGSSTGTDTAGAGPGVGTAGEAGSAAAGASSTAAGAGTAFFAGAFLAGAFLTGAEALAGGGKASVALRTAGASIVDEAVLTYSPLEFSHSSSCLLGTPSSFASADTRVLPGT
jgi:hypothetical protein